MALDANFFRYQLFYPEIVRILTLFYAVFTVCLITSRRERAQVVFKDK